MDLNPGPQQQQPRGRKEEEEPITTLDNYFINDNYAIGLSDSLTVLYEVTQR